MITLTIYTVIIVCLSAFLSHMITKNLVLGRWIHNPIDDLLNEISESTNTEPLLIQTCDRLTDHRPKNLHGVSIADKKIIVTLSTHNRHAALRYKNELVTITERQAKRLNYIGNKLLAEHISNDITSNLLGE